MERAIIATAVNRLFAHKGRIFDFCCYCFSFFSYVYIRSSFSIVRKTCVKFRTNKLIYRRYAGLFFTICCDVTDNELVTLEAIHLFVEILDQYFQNVCELDLVFNFHKVYLILDEFIIGGEFQETSKKVTVIDINTTNKIKYAYKN